MFTVKTLNKISNVGLSKFDEAKYTIDDNTQSPDAIMVRSAAMHDMEMPESLLAIARAGAGVNNIPIPKCTDLGIAVFNTPGAKPLKTRVTMSAKQLKKAKVLLQALKSKVKPLR